jgi:hypothetical protein
MEGLLALRPLEKVTLAKKLWNIALTVSESLFRNAWRSSAAAVLNSSSEMWGKTMLKQSL